MARAKFRGQTRINHREHTRKKRYLAAIYSVESLEQRTLLTTVVVTGAPQDQAVNSVGGFKFIGDQSVRVGDNGTNANEQAWVIPFQVPTIPTGQGVTSASLSVWLQSIGNATSVVGGVDVYGLGWRTSPTILASDYFEGAYNTDGTDATAVQNNIMLNNTPVGTISTNSTGNTALTNYIKAQIAAGAPAGSYIFLRFNAQSNQSTSRFWVMSSSDNATTTQRPALTITYNPLITAPSAPSNLKVAVTGQTSIKLTWNDNSNNETGFVIERSTDGVNFSTVTTTAAGVTSFDNITGLSANTQYYYRVKAINAGGSSAYTAITSNKTLPTFTRTLWVDPSNPNATPDGSYGNAYKTIASAIAVAVAGDGIVVRGGTYAGRVNITKSGTTTAPITLMAAPGERTIISGFAPVTGWVQGSGNIYTTTVTTAPTTLYAGMKILKQARGPDNGWWVWQSVTSNATAGTTTITDTAHLVGIGNLAGGSVQMHVSSGNLYSTVPILSNDPVAGTITIATKTGLAPTDIYMIKNKPSLVNQPGEWASEDLGNGQWRIHYWAENAADRNITQTRSVTTSLITISSGMSNLVIDGFEVAGSRASGIDIQRGTNVTIKNNITHDNTSAGIYNRFNNGITVNNNISFMNTTGVVIATTSNATVTQNEIAYNTTDGLVLAGDISGKAPGDVGFTPSINITASKNYIHNQSYLNHSDGIQMYRWLTDVDITDNVVMNNEQGIMTEEVNDTAVPGTATMTGNVIWGSSASLIIFGHNNSNNWTFDHNTIGGGGLGIFQLTGVNYAMTNNVMVGMVTAPATYTGNHNLMWTTASDGAIFRNPSFVKYTTIAAWNAYSGQDANSVKGDPLFTNVPLHSSESIVIGSTANSLPLRSSAGFAVGDKIEIGKDGVVRTITGITGNTITFDVPLGGAPIFAMQVYNWGTRTNFSWNTTLAAGSPGLTMSSTGGRVGSLINVPQYIAGDFTGDGKRDIPVLPADLSYPPDLSHWPA
jgi:hypothetical protein